MCDEVEMPEHIKIVCSSSKLQSKDLQPRRVNISAYMAPADNFVDEAAYFTEYQRQMVQTSTKSMAKYKGQYAKMYDLNESHRNKGKELTEKLNDVIVTSETYKYTFTNGVKKFAEMTKEIEDLMTKQAQENEKTEKIHAEGIAKVEASCKKLEKVNEKIAMIQQRLADKRLKLQEASNIKKAHEQSLKEEDILQKKLTEQRELNALRKEKLAALQKELAPIEEKHEKAVSRVEKLREKLKDKLEAKRKIEESTVELDGKLDAAKGQLKTYEKDEKANIKLLNETKRNVAWLQSKVDVSEALLKKIKQESALKMANRNELEDQIKQLIKDPDVIEILDEEPEQEEKEVPVRHEFNEFDDTSMEVISFRIPDTPGGSLSNFEHSQMLFKPVTPNPMNKPTTSVKPQCNNTGPSEVSQTVVDPYAPERTPVRTEESYIDYITRVRQQRSFYS